jgi:hypothetical protein
MTGVKLQHYLSESGIFTIENVFMVEILDGVIHNRVPTYYKCRLGYVSLNIRLFRQKNGNGDIWVDFELNNTNLYATHKLNELTLSTLVKELDKIFASIPDIRHLRKVERYKEWRLTCLVDHRNDLIESIL